MERARVPHSRHVVGSFRERAAYLLLPLLEFWGAHSDLGLDPLSHLDSLLRVPNFHVSPREFLH